jgi:NAD-dependent deacetylase
MLDDAAPLLGAPHRAPDAAPADRLRASIDAAARSLAGARRVVALTGAGMSAESGIATFRDEDGLWSAFDPEEVATPAAFERNGAKVWRWYAERRRGMAGARPNAGHLALAELERSLASRGGSCRIVTQNIDGLHAAAGSEAVIAVHGDIQRAKCFDCRADAGPAARFDDAADLPPACPACGGRLRPDVVWFNEALPMNAVGRALAAIRACDVLLVVGTSGLVEPVNRFPFAAIERRACVIEVNPSPTPLSPWATHLVRARAAEALPVLVAAALAGA